jgi:nitrite reductase (NADH) large subunit
MAPVIVVGTGPVGIRFVSELLKANPLQTIIIFGNEPWLPYNRVKLSSLLANDVSWESVTSTEWKNIQQHPNVTHYLNCPIVKIDKTNHQVIDADGHSYQYCQLVLAIGSRPFLPNIPNIDIKGVYTFRDLTDVQALFARSVRSRHVCVLGGGLLGLETAKALARHNTQVTVIQRASHIMNNQLSEEPANRLRDDISGNNFTIRCSEAVMAISGDEEVTGVELRSGEVIACDTVIVSTGILPNKELALNNNIAVGRGIRVNECLQTSDEHIFAIGECAEYKGTTYGLVAPGYEQAAVAASYIANNNNQARYLGSTTASQLKIVGEDVFSIGEINVPQSPTAKVWIFKNKKSYRKIIVHHGKIIGAHSLGDWPEAKRITEMCATGKRIYIWQLWRFNITGLLFGEKQSKITEWPDTVNICQCMSVSKGEISACISRGCASLVSIAADTGAGTVCGSCKPLMVELLSATTPVKLDADKRWKTLIQTSFFAGIFSLIFLLIPAFAYSLSVQETRIDMLWIDSLFKQISGFSLLTLSVLITLLSLRKRFKRFKWLEYSTWRVIHAALGIVLLMVLITHTGLHLGSNLNFALMISYIIVSVVGSLAGITVALEHKIKPSLLAVIKKASYWGHLLSSWPLPTLLTFHILSVYYF